MRRLRITLGALGAAALLAGGGCGGQDAAVVTVTGAPGLVFKHMAVTLAVGNAHKETVDAPLQEAGPIKLPTTVSFTFPSGLTGYMLVHVEARDGNTTVASGDGNGPIAKGGLTNIDVLLQ